VSTKQQLNPSDELIEIFVPDSIVKILLRVTELNCDVPIILNSSFFPYLLKRLQFVLLTVYVYIVRKQKQ